VNSLQTSLKQLPNAITWSRVAALPVLLWLAYEQSRWPFAFLLIACLIGDILDGLLARWLNATSDYGAQLDSVADALLLWVAAWGAWVFHQPVMREHFVLFAAVPGLFVLENLAAFVRYRRLSSFHTTLSRIAAYALGLFIGVLFLFGYQHWLAVLAVGLLFLATFEEFVLLWMLPVWTPNVGGVLRIRRQKRGSAAV
jgi:phosphatidylglycerophosphate synthase